ncbi:MAG: metallophosphoesterase [Mesorhizobium sp.]
MDPAANATQASMTGERLDRRRLLLGLAGAACGQMLPFRVTSAAAGGATDATFLFTNDIHACRMGSGLSPSCQQEGKTDAHLLRHVAALNRISQEVWPERIGGAASGLAGAGTPIAPPLGLVVGGDMTDDGGGQTALPGEGTQLQQFSQRYQRGLAPDSVTMPVYAGLGNHDLDQDGPTGHVDWYRRELRDYVELNHRQSVFFKPPVPADSYDIGSDCYSWNWGGLHLVQTHRFAGDTKKGAPSSLRWLADDLSQNAGDGRPVILFQHYGWDAFSIERWDPAARRFDDRGRGNPHWWSAAERRALLDLVSGYNLIGIFHGHEHVTPMIYRRDGLDLFKPKAAYLGGFAVVRVTDTAMDVVLAEAADDAGAILFTHGFSKPIAWRKGR